VDGVADNILGYVNTEVAEIKTVTDKLADTLEDNDGTYRFTAAAVSQTSCDASGSGTLAYTIKAATSGGAAIYGASVFVTTDAAGSYTVAGPSTTNVSGEVTFMLDPGTYYAWMSKDGYTFTNPQTVTVS